MRCAVVTPLACLVSSDTVNDAPGNKSECCDSQRSRSPTTTELHRPAQTPLSSKLRALPRMRQLLRPAQLMAVLQGGHHGVARLGVGQLAEV